MQEVRLDILAPKEDQLKILVPYLEEAAKYPEGEEPELPMTLRTRTLVMRYMGDWLGLYNRNGLTAQGAFKYYRRLKEDQ